MLINWQKTFVGGGGGYSLQQYSLLMCSTIHFFNDKIKSQAVHTYSHILRVQKKSGKKSSPVKS